MNKKLFTFIVVFFPIFSVYETAVSRLSFADMLAIFSLLLCTFHFLTSKDKVIPHISVPLLVFGCFIFVTFLFQIQWNTGVGVLSTFRYLLYIVLLFYCFRFFDYNFGIKVLEIATLGISIVVILQFSSFFFLGQTIPWYIPGLKVMDPKFILAENTSYYLTYYRPTGVFQEPTHFAQYSFVYLTYLLFGNNERKIAIFKTLLISTAIIVCGSSLGLITLLFLWFIWFIKTRGHKISLATLGAIILIIISIPALFKLDYFNRIISRVTGDSFFSGAAVGYRFDSISFFMESDLSLRNLLLGFGRSTEEAYFTGIFYFLHANGLVGVIIFLWLCIFLILKSRDFSRWLVITVLFLSIGSEHVANFGLLFYFSFVFGSYRASMVSLEKRISQVYTK